MGAFEKDFQRPQGSSGKPSDDSQSESRPASGCVQQRSRPRLGSSSGNSTLGNSRAHTNTSSVEVAEFGDLGEASFISLTGVSEVVKLSSKMLKALGIVGLS